MRAWDVLDPRTLEVLGKVPREQFVPAAFQDAGIQGAVFRPLAETIERSRVFAAWRQDSAAALRHAFLAECRVTRERR